MDIREKVARAISKKLYINGDDLSEDREHGTEWILADAALSACRYHEMREALEKIVVIGTSPFADRHNVSAMLNQARAALGGTDD